MAESRRQIQSAFREKLIEHLLVGELLKRSWQTGDCSIEISRPEVDRSGYDLIAECNGHVRHIQLKTSYHDAKTATQKVNLSLAQKPSGCVLWVQFDPKSLELGPFLYFGGKPGEKLPDLGSFRTAKHSKGNALGKKAERPNHRVVNNGQFTSNNSIKDLWGRLFGVDLRRGSQSGTRPRASAPTTVPGFRNRNGQTVIRGTGLPGNDHNQRIYELKCGNCGHRYGANGSDIWQRRCPSCDVGRPGLSLVP